MADGDVRWLTVTGGTLTGTGDASGLMVGLYRVRSPRVSGAAISALQVRAFEQRGVAVATTTDIRRQRGLTIGVFNDARQLRGVQIGLLNRARNNPGWAQWLPIINAHF